MLVKKWRKYAYFCLGCTVNLGFGVMFLTGSYFMFRQEVPRAYEYFHFVLTHGQSGLFDFLGAFFNLAVECLMGLAIATFGVWLPYWSIFGKHSERP